MINSIRKTKRALGLALLTAMLTPALASAEHEPGQEGGTTVMVISTAPSTSTSTTAAALITVTNPFFSSSTSSTTADTLFGSKQDTENYIRQNAVAMQTDLSVGAGESVSDLASMCGIAQEDLAAFGKLLRAERATLLAYVDPASIDGDRAVGFAAHIEGAMRRDSRLKRYTRAIAAQ